MICDFLVAGLANWGSCSEPGYLFVAVYLFCFGDVHRNIGSISTFCLGQIVNVVLPMRTEIRARERTTVYYTILFPAINSKVN